MEEERGTYLSGNGMGRPTYASHPMEIDDIECDNKNYKIRLTAIREENEAESKCCF
jgi:hypothetical protein